MERRGDMPVQLNQSMALAYSHFNGIKLPDEWLDPDFDGFDKDPLTFRMKLYDWLKSSPLELNFNTKNFTNLLQPFDRQSAKSLTQLEKVGELTLMPEAVLGIFPQAGRFWCPITTSYWPKKERLIPVGNEEQELETIAPLYPRDWKPGAERRVAAVAFTGRCLAGSSRSGRKSRAIGSGAGPSRNGQVAVDR